MKRFTAAIGFCVSLLLLGLFVFLPTADAEKNLLENLLNLPAPPPPNPLVVNGRKIRPVDFLNKNKPPADDAASEDLLAYWQNINQFNEKFTYTPDPSDITLKRLRGEIEKNPELLPSLLNALPNTSESVNFVKDLYDRETFEKKYERSWREAVKRWLTYHSNYFSDELARVAEQASDTGEYVTHQDELLALARVDWDKARPILERLLNDRNQPISQTLARWAFYERAVRENDSNNAEKCRKELQQTVENKSEKPGNRDLAMDALVEAGDFEGRDEWYFSLLEDETLHDLRVNGTSYTGLTTLLNHSPSDKYVAKMLELSKSSNAAARSAAVRNLSTLLGDKNPEVVEALLPWLENPKWARETNNERRLLVSALREFAMPASIPGLIAVLNEKQSQEIRTSSMNTNIIAMNSNMMNANRPMVVSRTVDYYPYRDEAVSALATQKDIRAATPLRMILPQVENWQRGNVVRAILLSRGFSVAEQIEALEFIAKNYNQPSEYSGNTMSNTNTVRRDIISGGDVPPSSKPAPYNDTLYNTVNRPFNPSDIKPLLGAQLVNQSDAEEELVTALIDRIGILDAKDPQLALGLRKIMQNWNGAAVNRLLLKDLKTNRADTDSVVKLLSLRKELREKQPNDIYDVRGGTPVALGIAACLIEDANGYDALLAGENGEAKTAMLACARLIRAVLPVRRVTENLTSPNKMLAIAAERYLASEDSPEARQFVLALHPNEAKILGARTYFAPDNSPATNSAYLPALFQSVNESLPAASYYIHYDYSEDLMAAEKRLQKEVRENQELLGVYSYADNFVRIYKDRAVFSWREDPARYRERELEKEEFDNLKNYLAAERVDELPPFLSECEGECEGEELLMLGRQGGRRVFSLGGDPQPKFFAGLERIFTEMRQPPAKLHYWLEKSVADLGILFEDENLQAEAVWKAGDDFRVLINNQARRKQIDREIEQQDEAEEEKIGEMAEAEDNYEKYEKFEEERQKRRERREFENYGWYQYANGKLAGITEQPSGIDFLPKADGAAVRAASNAWKARTEAFEIRSDSEGLYKVSGGRMTKIREGYHDKPLVTANGRWLITTRYGEEGRQLIRINLLTNKEFNVNFEAYPLGEPVAYLPLVNRVLLFGGEYGEYEEETDLAERAGEYFFLDPETGAVQKAKGEVRPLAQQTFRPLQSNGNVGEFWAAVPDQAKAETQIGVYNQKNLAFKSLIKIPQITFNSMQMWVDEGKVYFVYAGHLLALPLPKENKKP
jgi:hypothetical protein